MATKPMGVRLSEDMVERLKAIGEKKDRSPHYLVKKAVEDFVHEEEKLLAEIELMDGRRKHYEITGEHYTHEEVKAYFIDKINKRKSS